MLHMEQKDYNLEIVSNLLKRPNHIRGLAKSISINHMMIVRKIKKLFDENVVDYRQEGKNKLYFLKNTAEARTYILMAEQYKLIKILMKYPHLRKIINKIQEHKKIKLAILFGSYAKAIAKKDSDIDIYVETEDRKLRSELELIDSKLSVKIGKYNKISPLIREIEKNYAIIKGAERYHERFIE